MTPARSAHSADAHLDPEVPSESAGHGAKHLSGDPKTHHGMGRIEGDAPGPLVVIVCGMHGNEPAGVRALQNVLEKIRDAGIAVHGTLVALKGNVAACAAGKRLIDTDLNRLWTRERVERMRAITLDECVLSEERELWGMVREVDQLLEGAPVDPTPVFIDLHTASAQSVPFAIARNTLDHLSLFRGLPIPIIAGLEERLEGLLLKHIIDRGGRTVAVETGPHDGENAVTELEAVLWILLERTGSIGREAIPGGESSRTLLRKLCRGIPPIVEAIHRHEVVNRAEFEMEQGFKSFDSVAANRLLAIDHSVEVRAPRSCRVLMPLYQEVGNDGFFLGLDRDRLYLFLSEWFRRFRLEWTIGLFPSVRREPSLEDGWRVDRSDRRAVREALRFFGYREQIELRSGAILASRLRR